MGKYLRMYWSKLGDNKIDTQAELKRSILCRNTMRADSIIEHYMGICLRMARK